MEMNDSEDLQRLLRLKRYESPGDEYFRSFVDEFKERQRSEMLKQSARGLLFERVSMWLEESGGARRFAPAGALAAAMIGAGVYFALPSSDAEQPPEPAFVGLPASESAPAGARPDEDIHLKLPHPVGRVPGISADRTHSSPGLLPAGAQSSLREL